MEHTAKYVVNIVIASLVLAVAGDILFQNADWGINMALGLLILAGATFTLQFRNGVAFPRYAGWIALPALVAATGFALRASPTLAALGTIALVICLFLGARYCQTGRYAEQGILASLGAMMRTVKESFLGSFLFLRQDIPKATEARVSSNSRQGLAAGRGVLLAIPLLLVFGGLLSSADPVFAHYVSALFQWDFTDLWVRFAWISFGFFLAGGGLRTLLRTEPSAEPSEDAPPRAGLGHVETAIILGALDALFFLFVLVQFRYFFGGRETILSTVGMTYAAYARHGFFELVTVAGLSLPLLLILHTFQQRQTLAAETLFRSLAGLLLILLFAIMASALVRMNLYRSEYGLTELRVYTTAFMGWLAVVFLWFGVTVLRGRRQHFTMGAGVSAFAAIVLLFAWNPDAAIVRANAALSHTGHRFDTDYVVSLSPDAVPELVADLPRLRPLDQQAVAAGLIQRWPAQSSEDWRSWCWGRWTARRCLNQNHVWLLALSKPAPVSFPAKGTVAQNTTITKIVPATAR